MVFRSRREGDPFDDGKEEKKKRKEGEGREEEEEEDIGIYRIDERIY